MEIIMEHNLPNFVFVPKGSAEAEEKVVALKPLW